MKNFYLAFLILFFSSTALAQSEFWGVNTTGGASNWGTIYKMDFDGSDYTVMHDFDFTYGGTPMGSLAMASDGNLYGTCYDGGSWASCTIYRIDPTSGVFTHLWDFDITTGDFPMGGVVDYDNKMYGFAWSGGTSMVGVIYYWDYVAGTYAVAHNFNGTDGSSIYSEPLLIGSKLYGAASSGGAYSVGCIFEFDIATSTMTTLHSFNSVDGSTPMGGLILADNGKLYGMTSTGGADNLGVIYSYDPATATFDAVYDFATTEGNSPTGRLLQGADGLLYGMTSVHNGASTGTIFSFDPITENISWLHTFDGANGGAPSGDLAQYGDVLYGVTSSGGSSNGGTHFQYNLTSDLFTKTRDLDATTGTNPTYGNYILLGVDPSEIDETQTSALRLYPTVSDGNITLSDFTNGTLRVTDLSGKICHSELLTGPSANVNLDVSAGTYLWQFNDGTSGQSGKLVIR
jgi:uncharacterized repeat protein (TIGR03803 family)